MFGACASVTTRRQWRSICRSLLTTQKCLIITITLLLHVILVVDAFGNKKKKQQQQQQEQEALEAELAKTAAEAEACAKQKMMLATGVLGLLGIVIYFLVSKMKKTTNNKTQKGNRAGASGTVDVVVVGVGLPKRGMGWYHLIQLLEMTNVNVIACVEPFFLNPDLCKKMPESFASMVSEYSALGIQFTDSVMKLDDFERKTVCLVAGRTADNPKLFTQCVQKGATCIYLEKPGAPSVKELEDMKSLADKSNVKVYLGYNKNVTPYVTKALDLAKTIDNSHVLFCHNNSYEKNELPECFTRNSEGMLKNMVIHEMALLVTFFGVTVETIDSFDVNTNKLFSERETIWKPGTVLPDPVYITDFVRIAFKITTKDGKSVSVMGDRCGGNVSFAVVKDAKGSEVQKFEVPDAATMKKVEEQVKADPEMMPYFFVQSDDYQELKDRVVKSTLDGSDATGVATIGIAIEALRLAEYGTEKMNAALDAATT